MELDLRQLPPWDLKACVASAMTLSLFLNKCSGSSRHEAMPTENDLESDQLAGGYSTVVNY